MPPLPTAPDRATPTAPARILFCGVEERIRALAAESFSEERAELVTAPDAAAALSLLGAGKPSLVLVGGESDAAVAASCRLLRADERCRGSLILAAADERGEVAPLLAAGADDFFMPALGDAVLRSRLLVGRRSARAIEDRAAAWFEQGQFFNLTQQLFCVAGFDGRFKMVNSGWTTVLGWSKAELVGTPSLDLVHPDDRERTLEMRARLRGGQSVRRLVNRYRCKDGSYRWLSWESSSSVERRAVYAVARDVTEATRSAEELRELTESLAVTLSSIGDAVISTDADAAVLRMNPAAETLTGWPEAEALGKPLSEVLPLVNTDTRAKVENPVERTLREGAVSTLAVRTVLLRRDGAEIPVADGCSPIRSNKGAILGAVLVLRDQTEHRAAEEAEASHRRQMILADRMASVGTLAAGVAHEINNPLAYVSANVDFCLEEIRGLMAGSQSVRLPELEGLLVETREGVSRVAKIVRALKTFSRVDEEKIGLVELEPVVELAIAMVWNQIRHSARLVKESSPAPKVRADDARLGQVFINLLVNASQAFATQDAAANEIGVAIFTDAAGRAVVEVRDTGVGIPKHVLGRVFDPFFTTKPVGVGTGLGLAISHSIVASAGGELSVESRPGRTVFRVSLPPAAEAQPSAPPLEPAAASAQSKSGAVLVVDDEPALGVTIRRTLRGHEVTVVGSGLDALAVLATGKRFDVILSDLMMPGMSGVELYQEIARLHPALAARVVFLTGGAFTPQAHDFLAQVPNLRVDKPFDSDHLRALVQRMVD